MTDVELNEFALHLGFSNGQVYRNIDMVNKLFEARALLEKQVEDLKNKIAKQNSEFYETKLKHDALKEQIDSFMDGREKFNKIKKFVDMVYPMINDQAHCWDCECARCT